MTLTECTRALMKSRRGKHALGVLELFLPTLESLTTEQRTAVAELVRRAGSTPANVLEAVRAALADG